MLLLTITLEKNATIITNPMKEGREKIMNPEIKIAKIKSKQVILIMMILTITMPK